MEPEFMTVEVFRADFATFFDCDGRVTRVEVVAYREPYGDGIRSQRFRKQFVGEPLGLVHVAK